VSTNWQGDTWTYDFSTRAWREINSIGPPYTVFEQTMVYDSANRKLVAFGGAPSGYVDGDRAYLLDVDSEVWTAAASAPEPGARMSQSMVYDPVRRVAWMFGGGYPYPSAGNELWSYDAAARTWRQINQTGAVPPPRRFGAMAYDSQHDIVLLWGGILDDNNAYNDTWVFRPATQQWQQLAPTASPPRGFPYSEDLAYDPVNNVFILHQNGDFWLYRFGSSTDTTAPDPPRNLVAH
jgi:hypothetical protein